MEKTSIKVQGMSCEHCVKAITKAVGVMPGVQKVEVDLKTGTVTVEYDSVQSPQENIVLEIEEQGYDVIRWQKMGVANSAIPILFKMANMLERLNML